MAGKALPLKEDDAQIAMRTPERGGSSGWTAPDDHDVALLNRHQLERRGLDVFPAIEIASDQHAGQIAIDNDLVFHGKERAPHIGGMRMRFAPLEELKAIDSLACQLNGGRRLGPGKFLVVAR